MCGIIGIIGNPENGGVANRVVEGLKRLEYRGYDSAGLPVIDRAGELQFRKTVGKVNGLISNGHEDWIQGSIGLGHTRWATHGRPSHANAHPHTDCSRRIAVVHNGIVENFLELKRGLLAGGHRFSSETDSEGLSHLIEDGMERGLD